jgi:hypothetical protein
VFTLPSEPSTSIRGPETVPQVDQKLCQFKYARIPRQVLLDKRLTPATRVVYCFLAAQIREETGNVVSVGQRRIAQLLWLSRTTVALSIGELEKCGHIKITASNNARSTYFLTSDLFSTGSVAKKWIAHKCYKCNKIARVNKACICTSCVKKEKLRLAGIELEERVQRVG